MAMIVGLMVFSVLAVGQGKDTYLSAYVESHVPHQPPAEGVVYPEPHPVYGPPTVDPLDKAKSTLLPQALKILAIILKIILKLTFFKIIVKFIAVVCLLLFIPTLDFKPVVETMMDADGKQDGKSINLEELAELVKTGIHKYGSYKSLVKGYK